VKPESKVVESAENMSTHQIIGVGAGKFLGMQRIFTRISPILPETFAYKSSIFSHKDYEDFFLE